jgi:hypothetical protein
MKIFNYKKALKQIEKILEIGLYLDYKTIKNIIDSNIQNKEIDIKIIEGNRKAGIIDGYIYYEPNENKRYCANI